MRSKRKAFASADMGVPMDKKQCITMFERSWYETDRQKWRREEPEKLHLNFSCPKEWAEQVAAHAKAHGLKPAVIGEYGGMQCFPPDDEIDAPYVCMFTEGEYLGYSGHASGQYRVILDSDNFEEQGWQSYARHFNAIEEMRRVSTQRK